MLLLIFAAGVFLLIGFKTDWNSTWKSVSSANWAWFTAATVFMLSAHWMRGARWTLLTTPAGYPLHLLRSFYAVMVGYLVNVATSRGGELARCALASKSEKAPVELLVGTVVTERIVDLLMLLLVCIATLLLQFKYLYSFFEKYVLEPLVAALNFKNILIFSIIFIALLALAFWFIKRRKKSANLNQSGVKGVLARFTEGLKTVFQLQKPVLFMLYSLGIWVGYWLSTYCLLQSLDVTAHLNVYNALSVVIFASIGIAIPLPAGAGVWGAVSVGLSTVYGLPTANAETYGIYTLAVSNIQMITFGAIAYFLLYFEMIKINATNTK